MGHFFIICFKSSFGKHNEFAFVIVTILLIFKMILRKHRFLSITFCVNDIFALYFSL